MINYTEAQILFAIKRAAEGTDAKVIAGLIQGALLKDVAMVAVAQQLEDSRWRYRLVNGPVIVQVESTESMMAAYRPAINKVSYIADRFGILDKETDFGFRSLDYREPLGAACKEASLEAARVNEHLLPTDEPLDTKSHVRMILRRSGFKWDGDYDVERHRGENKKLLKQAISHYTN